MLLTTTPGRRCGSALCARIRNPRLEARGGLTEGQQWYLDEDDWAGNDGEPIPGSAEGRTYVFDEPHREAGYEPLYQGRAVAWRGDIVMIIEYANNAGPVDEKALKSLAKRQLERL